MYTKFITPIIWIFSFFVLLFLYTRLFGPVPFSVNSVSTQKSTTFDVAGEGKVSIAPDIASITVGISIQAPTVKSAQDQINGVINKVSQNLKKIGVDSKDIQSTNYSINPTYDYSGGTQKITGYNANTNLLVEVRNLENINSVIDIATDNGANQVSGLQFSVDDRSKVEEQARQKAVDEAKKKAEAAAKIAGFRLGRIINYSENLPGFPQPMLRTMDVAKAVGAPTQVEPGSAEVTVTVTLSYEIL